MTELLLPVAAATGLVLFAAGLPRRGRPLSSRVDPYLPGAATSSSRGGRLRRFILEIAPPGPTVGTRLEAAGAELDSASFRIRQAVVAALTMIAVVCTGMIAATAGAVLDPVATGVFVVVSGGVAWFGHDWLLGRAVVRRAARIRDDLPTAIDLLVLALLAGDSVPAAFTRVARFLPPAMSNELLSAAADVRAGSPMVDSLERLAARTPEPAVGRMCDALCTALEKGTPLAEVLRGQAEDARELRRRTLLEMGGRREVLMLVPVVFLILPTVVLFAVYPGLVSLELLVP